MTPKPPSASRPWWKNPASRKAGFWTLAALVLGFLAWLFFFFPYVATDDAQVAATLVRLAPQGDGGRVVAIAVDAGSPVTQGQVLLETDHAPAQARLSQAQAGAALARLDLTRAQKLFSQGAVPVSDLDRARAADEKAQADLALAQSALADTYLRSPFNGTVVEKTAEVGDMLERGQTALTLADMAHAWVAADVEETSVGRVKVGQPARVTVDEGGTLTGRVSEITAAAESQFSIIPMENPSGNFIKLVQRIPIRVALDDPSRLPLKAGESVEVRIRVR